MGVTADIGRVTPTQRVLDLAQRLAACSEDEIAVLEHILAGVEKGREVYGPMVLATDLRDLTAEADDEARDWIIYRAMRSVQRARLAAAQEATRRG
jgi:hypothetical protein